MDIRIYVELLVRWIHVVAGIVWIGHLYFFNFVNAQLAKTYDAESKKKVIPELMPRALYWFRWGAAYTWITGFLLLGIVYYSLPQQLVNETSGLGTGATIGISIAGIVLVFFIYDAIWKAVKNETVGVIISFILYVAALFVLARIFTGRALYVHAGGLLGTAMFLNVWMRIWPAQKKIIAGIKGTGAAPDAAIAAMAGLRSKHNTYMSVPLVYFMVSNHYPQLYGSEYSWAIAALIVLVGWMFTKLLYSKSAGPEPVKIGDQPAPPAPAPK